MLKSLVKFVLLASIGLLLFQVAIGVASSGTGTVEKMALLVAAGALVVAASRVWQIGIRKRAAQ